ncbi:exodeoxyribonuclease V subunit gamma [Myxococcota bacterium]|nr:exodeoxyribonuclease V subunit gamma [Myxococcota bacterium]
MLRLAYAARAEDLARALSERLAARRREGLTSPLQPIDVIVPTRATQAWLKLEIARRTGIAANLRFDFLERFLTKVIEGEPHAPRPRGRPKLRVAGTDVLESVLLAILSDASVLSRPELAQVRGYLTAGHDDDELELRRIQLASELSRLFGEYLLARRDVLRTWRGRTTLDETPFAPIERWQRTLWLELEARLRAGSSDELRLVTLPDAFDLIPPEQLDVPPELHVFALRMQSPVLVSMIARIAQRADVFVWALNPVRHPWDDTGPDDTPLLRMWGRAGREHVRLLNELTEGDFDDAWSEPDAASSLLASVQHDVLDRAPVRGEGDRDPRFVGDPGISFLQCPGARREVEVIASEIWSLVKASEAAYVAGGPRPLRFNEIAVVLAGREPEVHRAHVAAVFQEHHQIPHHHLDVPIRGSSRIVEALELLLALPYSDFTRQDALKLVMHPAILAHAGEADGAEWLRWLDALSVVHGADHGDHADTYIEKDLYNWDQGLRRLVLGAFMSGEASGELGTFAIGGSEYLPHEVPLDRLGSAARLVTLVRSLVADARWLRGARMNLAAWSRVIARLLSSYVGRPAEEDERDVRLCLGVVQQLERLDVTHEVVSFRVAASLVSSALSGLTSGRGQPLADGVAVGSLAALSFIPFRVVFVTGLGEGNFPASEARSQLDLRVEERRRGDVSVRDEDEWLFLERLLATRERVYLSWVSRDARTGDALEPSTIVQELEHVLTRGYVEAPHLVRHPLRRWDDGYFSAESVVSPAVRAERVAFELRADLLAKLGRRDAVQTFEAGTLARALPPDVWSPLSKRLGLTTLPARAEEQAERRASEREAEPADRVTRPGTRSDAVKTLAIPHSALRRFLEDPAEGWVRYVLGMRETDRLEDPLAREEETFETSSLDAAIFLRELLAEKVERDASGAKAEFAELYDARAARLELAGRLPTGVFGRAERARHLEILASWHRAMVERCGVGARLSPAFRYGRAQENQEAVDLVDPLVIDVELPTRRLRVELSGRTEPSIVEPGRKVTSLIPLLRDAGTNAKGLRSERDALRAFVDHAVLAALGREELTRQALVLYSGDEPFALDLEPFGRDEAILYLRTVLTDLLSEPHAYDLRFERVLAVRTGASEGRDDGGARRYSGLPPLPRLPAEREAEVIERRFGAYFERRREVKK